MFECVCSVFVPSPEQSAYLYTSAVWEALLLLCFLSTSGSAAMKRQLQLKDKFPRFKFKMLCMRKGKFKDATFKEQDMNP